MKTLGIALLSLLAASLLLSGCTINPRDVAPASSQQGNTDEAAEGAGVPNQQGGTGSPSAQPGNGSQAEAGSSGSTGRVVLSPEEVAKHSTESDCWMIISGRAYDLSSFSMHAGGTAFVPFCGKDATEAFQTKAGKGQNHSAKAYSFLPNFEVGALGSAATPKSMQAAQQNRTSSSNSSKSESGGYEDEYGED